jgi:hypothetical protein
MSRVEQCVGIGRAYRLLYLVEPARQIDQEKPGDFGEQSMVIA